MTTFTTVTTGVVLTSPMQNPSTLVAGGYIGNTTALYAGDAVYGSTAAMWTFTNSGVIQGVGTDGYGVDFRAGGIVSNNAGARIVGGIGGIRIQGSPRVDGVVTNQMGGTISGGLRGIEVTGANGTITNFGTITATAGKISGPNSYAVELRAGGTVSNNTGGQIVGGIGGIGIQGSPDVDGIVTNQTGGTIIGNFVGVEITGAKDTITNFGTITSGTTGSFGVVTDGQTKITNYGNSGGSVTNFGTIIGGALLNETSYMLNQGLIQGGRVQAGVYVSLATCVNRGLIEAGRGGVGIVAGYVPQGRTGGGYGFPRTLTNFGTVAGGPDGLGIRLNGGTVVNFGTITAGGSTGIGVGIRGGSFLNDGLIYGSAVGVGASARLVGVMAGSLTVGS